MATFRGNNNAFGQPGAEPRWTHGVKDGIGTAYAASTHLWFTIWRGVVTEVYYPTVDRPQLRALQYLVSDGQSFAHEERRDLDSQIERLTPALGYRIRNKDPEGRYELEKEIITDPHLPCLLQRTRVKCDDALLQKLKLYAFCWPHLAGGGWGNNGHILRTGVHEVLAAERAGVWLAMAATLPFTRLSCGYVDRSDGLTDLTGNLQMDWEFDCALDGNVALTGELAVREAREFTLGLAFGASLHSALTALFQGLAVPFDKQLERYQEQWSRPCRARAPLEGYSYDEGQLYRNSYNLLLAHEDKTYQGAIIASLSIPWGEARGDEDGMGGYHLVWPRDMVQNALGLLAAGNRQTPLRALIYLATSQQADGSFAQNFWIDGTPHWKNIQLDEAAFPILLAHRLWREGALEQFDPYQMVLRATTFLARSVPITDQERWEENSGYSPSTLAATIAAFICAACFARDRGDEENAVFLEQYADFLEENLETWTVTGKGMMLPDGGEIDRYFVRINPALRGEAQPDEGVQDRMLTLTSRAPREQADFPAREIIDAGFLELVRYGIRRADDPLIVDSLRVVDAALKVETPLGPCWRRYNHDNYGQQDDGGPYNGVGKGRAWPLLTGERGHYELAAGNGVEQYIRAMERFASSAGLLAEQVWDTADLPEAHMYLGCPTGSAMPLAWAHAEYIKLLRSVKDGKVFDLIPEVAERYTGDRHRCHKLKVWSFAAPTNTIKPGATLRVQAEAEFKLRWSPDGWQTIEERQSTSTAYGVYYLDLPPAVDQQRSFDFTFFWPDNERWEGRDFRVTVR
jgi:glucoamylase